MKKNAWILIEVLVSLSLITGLGGLYLEHFISEYQHQKQMEKMIERQMAMQEKIRMPNRKVTLSSGEEVHYEKNKAYCRVWIFEKEHFYQYKARLYAH